MATAFAAPPPDLPASEAAERPTLRLIACGSVDDGKSTLLGRLLHDAHALATDQLEALAADSARVGTAGDAPDFALLLDGLEAEREQGITIDVAYRYFSSPGRAFILADTPGHEQFTRNMVTGASTADAAIILVDAGVGVLRQTRRHSRIVKLLGIDTVVLAVNKMDLVGFAADRFDAVVAEYAALAAQLGIARFTAVPVVARDGDNVVRASRRMGWYRGPAILDVLDAAPVAEPVATGFAMPVQSVLRPDAEFRGYAGRVAAGSVRPGAPVRVLPAGTQARVARIVAPDGDLPSAGAGRSTLLTFAEPVECARGDVIVGEGSTVTIGDSVGATLVWMAEAPLALGQRLLMKLGARTVPARVTAVESVFDPDSGDTRAAAALAFNDIGRATLALDAAAAMDSYARSRALGGFVLVDPYTNATVAAGLVERVETRWASDGGPAIHRVEAPAEALAALGARFAARLRESGQPTALLDAASLADLHADADPREAARRTAAAARLLHDAGLAVVIAVPVAEGVDLPGEPVAAADLTPSGDDWVI